MTTDTAENTPQGAVAPVRREVRVRCDVDTAFELFTAHLAAWWPLAEFSVFGAHASVAFEDGRVVERLGSQHAVWGTVLAWDRPSGFTMTWHPGQGPERATEVAVAFVAQSDGAGTMVTLTHRGWERLAEPESAREEYNSGWPHVLAGFGRLLEVDAAPDAEAGVEVDAGAEGEGEAEEHEWFALHHRPGAALADGESIFAHPLFPEHVAFLHRLDERGWLVAAGPVDAANGKGMAVVKVPAGSGPALQELIQEDASVVGGALTFSIQPWDVRFAGTTEP